MPERKARPRPSRAQTEKGEAESAAVGRPLWSGTISFGLVSVPVNLYPANRDSRVSLRMLGPEGLPLKRDFYSPETGREFSEAETVRGFETSKGKYVTVTDEELERLAPEKSRDINLRVFCPRNDISPVYFDRGYVLTPADKRGKAYPLLAKTMESSDRAGIATFVMRGKEYLVAIIARDGILRAETLRFRDEIRKPSDLGLPKRKDKTLTPQKVRAFDAAIARLGKKTLDRREMRDEYAEGMLKLIEKKRARREDVIKTEAAGKPPAKVIDLMEVLKKSLERSK